MLRILAFPAELHLGWSGSMRAAPTAVGAPRPFRDTASADPQMLTSAHAWLENHQPGTREARQPFFAQQCGRVVG